MLLAKTQNIRYLCPFEYIVNQNFPHCFEKMHVSRQKSILDLGQNEGRLEGALPRSSEQRQDRLRRLVGDRQCLNPKLLLGLQGLQTGRRLLYISVYECTYTRRKRIRQF